MSHYYNCFIRTITAINYADTISNAGKYYGYYYKNHYRLSCASSVQSLSTCSWSNRGKEYLNTLGVKCLGSYLYLKLCHDIIFMNYCPLIP